MVWGKLIGWSNVCSNPSTGRGCPNQALNNPANKIEKIARVVRPPSPTSGTRTLIHNGVVLSNSLILFIILFIIFYLQ